MQPTDEGNDFIDADRRDQENNRDLITTRHHAWRVQHFSDIDKIVFA
jgi:hypothetical protein